MLIVSGLVIVFGFQIIEGLKQIVAKEIETAQTVESKPKPTFLTYIIGFPIFAYFFLGKLCFTSIEKLENLLYKLTTKYVYDTGFKPVAWNKLGIVPTSLFPITFPFLLLFTIFQGIIIVLGYVLYKFSVYFTNFIQSIAGEIEKIFSTLK